MPSHVQRSNPPSAPSPSREEEERPKSCENARGKRGAHFVALPRSHVEVMKINKKNCP